MFPACGNITHMLRCDTFLHSFTDPTAVTTPSTSETLLKVLRQALRPLVRLMLAKGIAYPQLIELLKSLYVELAVRDFPVPGKDQTDSRISLLTGIHRKDVKRLRALPPADERVPDTVSFGMRLINAWQMPPFADEEGMPLPLPRLASHGGELSFETLVTSVSKDIRSRAVLDEWTRLGIASVDSDNIVTLMTDAFVPHQGFAEKAFYFGHNLHDHAAAAASNLLGERAPYLERSVQYSHLPASVVQALAKDAEGSGTRLLKTLNRKAQTAGMASQADGETVSAEAGQRFTFGIYFYADDAVDEAVVETAGVPPEENP